MFQFVERVKDGYIVLFLIILAILVNHTWLSFEVFSFSDYGFKFQNTIRDYSNISSWIFRSGLGAPDLLLWRTPLILLQSIFGHLGFGLNVADKFTIMWVWIVVSVSSSYLLVKTVTNSKVGGIIGSLIFAYNTYFISINSVGHFNISVASAIALFSLYFMLKTYESTKGRYIVLASLSLFTVGFYDLRILYIICGVYFAYFIFNLRHSNTSKKNVYVSLRNNIYIFFILGMLNAYWVLPTAVSRSIGNSQTLNRGLFGDQFWSLEAAIGLFHPFWNGMEPIWFEINKMPFYFYIIPVIAFLSLLLNRRNGKIVFFGIITMLGIFLSKQSDEPFGNIYVWLYNNLPGFNAFREATKFYFLTAVGYSILIGGFYSLSFNKGEQSKYHSLSKYICLLFIFFYLAVILKPLFTSDIGSTYIVREVPSDSVKVNQFINRQNEYFRTLVLPTYPHSWTYTNLHPRISMVNNLNDNWRHLFKLSTLSLDVNEEMKYILSQDYSNSLLDQSSIKYVVVPAREKEKKDDFFKFYGTDKSYYSQLVGNVSFLKEKESSLSETIIYENSNFRPKIYTTSSQETIYQEIPFRQVAYTQKTPSRYEIMLKNVRHKTYINFTERYNPKWIMIIGDFSPFSFSNILSEKFHIENDSGMNGYIIDPTFIRKNIPQDKYSVGQDGSISFEATILYYPDLFMYLGLVVSSVTFLALIAFLAKKNLNKLV